jgi:Chain length determinant protein
MDLFSIIGKVWRHKLATIPVLVLTALGAFYTLAIKAPVYQANAEILLTNPPPPPTAEQIARHPALGNINANNTFVTYGNLDVAADAVIGVVTAESDRLAAQGVDPRYQLTLSPDVGFPPVIQITGIGRTAQAAIHSASLVSQAARQSLYQLQARQGVNRYYMIKSVQLYPSAKAQVSASGKLRSLIAVIGLGAIMLFVVISVSEAMAKRRTAKMEPELPLRVETRVFTRADFERHARPAVKPGGREAIERPARRTS